MNSGRTEKNYVGHACSHWCAPHIHDWKHKLTIWTFCWTNWLYYPVVYQQKGITFLLRNEEVMKIYSFGLNFLWLLWCCPHHIQELNSMNSLSAASKYPFCCDHDNRDYLSHTGMGTLSTLLLTERFLSLWKIVLFSSDTFLPPFWILAPT